MASTAAQSPSECCEAMQETKENMVDSRFIHGTKHQHLRTNTDIEILCRCTVFMQGQTCFSPPRKQIGRLRIVTVCPGRARRAFATPLSSPPPYRQKPADEGQRIRSRGSSGVEGGISRARIVAVHGGNLRILSTPPDYPAAQTPVPLTSHAAGT